MGNLHSVLRNIFQNGDQARLLNDEEYFLQRMAAFYEPAFKSDCRLIERAVRQGAGNFIYRYLSQNSIPTVSETQVFLRQMQDRADFSASDAERAAGFLYYMVGWNNDGTTGTYQRTAPERPNTPEGMPDAAYRPVQSPPPPNDPVKKPGESPAGYGQKLREFLSSNAGHAILTIVLYVAFLAAITAIFIQSGKKNIMPLSMLIMIITSYFGWKELPGIQPGMFVFMPGIGWAVYFAFKFLISLAIGWFVTPWQLVKIIIGVLTKG